MSELPQGWERTKLGDLGKWSSGGTPSKRKSEYYDGGDIPWVTTGDLRDRQLAGVDGRITQLGLENSSAKLFPPETVLIAMYGATIGRLGVLMEESATNQACAALLPDEQNRELLPFVFRYLLSQRQNLRAIGQGGAQPNISQGVLKTYDIGLPPLNEQKRIVAKIEALSEKSKNAKESLDAIPPLLEKLRQSILAAAFRGDLTKEWREQNPSLPAPQPGVCFVYALQCEDGSIYIGLTSDIEKRWIQHVRGEGADWTKKHPPQSLVHWEKFASREAAAEREQELKTGFGRKWLKRELAAGRLRQAGEPASVLLERIKKERRAKWEEAQLAKYEAKGKKPPKNWQSKYVEPEPVDTEGLPELPDGWCWVRWDQVGFCQNGRAFPSEAYSERGVRLLRPGNLHMSGEVRWPQAATRHLPEEWAEKHLEHVVGGKELIMNLTAQSLKDEFLGRICLTATDERCLLNQRLGRLTPVGLTADFCFWVFKSRRFRAFVDTLNTGSLIQHMYTSNVDEFVFPLPPASEQDVVVEKLVEMHANMSVVHEGYSLKQDMFGGLDQAILAKAFRGELVEQDPNDEPASVLLERIRAERAAQEAEAKAKKKRKPRKKRAKA